MPLSLLCDEHIPYPVIEGLRRRGIDVTVVQQVGLRSSGDRAILEAAHPQGRIIYTCDADFLRLHAAGVSHGGIFYHHPDAYGYGEAIRRVGFACEMYSVAEMKGRVEFI